MTTLPAASLVSLSSIARLIYHLENMPAPAPVSASEETDEYELDLPTPAGTPPGPKRYQPRLAPTKRRTHHQSRPVAVTTSGRA